MSWIFEGSWMVGGSDERVQAVAFGSDAGKEAPDSTAARPAAREAAWADCQSDSQSAPDLNARLREHYGKEGEKLKELGLQPFRGRQPEPPPPPLPEDVR
ncbi:MAG TPA: hypothetical protein VN493_14420 [Thermoanaerobaculia bacterium]|nr:hypothetical protein [Thermoanaerobaculia bacterium]